MQHNSFDSVKLANFIIENLANAYGGHSQIPNHAYIDALRGQLRNRVFLVHAIDYDYAVGNAFANTVATVIINDVYDRWIDVDLSTGTNHIADQCEDLRVCMTKMIDELITQLTT
jgi:hypothetical protein